MLPFIGAALAGYAIIRTVEAGIEYISEPEKKPRKRKNRKVMAKATAPAVTQDVPKNRKVTRDVAAKPEGPKNRKVASALPPAATEVPPELKQQAEAVADKATGTDRAPKKAQRQVSHKLSMADQLAAKLASGEIAPVAS